MVSAFVKGGITMQRDVVLNLPLCSWQEINLCEDPQSNHKVMDIKDNGYEIKTIQTEEGTRQQHICELAVPGACPRVQCFYKEKEDYRPCRLIGLIQSQKNESGFWMKLPCSECLEQRNLHPTTKEFVYGEDTEGR